MQAKDVATSYNNLASVYCCLGEYNQAKELYEKTLMISKNIFGENHANVATMYDSLASVYSVPEKALMIHKKIFDEDHAGVGRSYNNLAILYNSLGEYMKTKTAAHS